MKNRVVGLEYVKAKDLVENEKNVKLHRKGQRDLFHKVLEKIGFAGAMVAYKNMVKRTVWECGCGKNRSRENINA